MFLCLSGDWVTGLHQGTYMYMYMYTSIFVSEILDFERASNLLLVHVHTMQVDIHVHVLMYVTYMYLLE